MNPGTFVDPSHRLQLLAPEAGTTVLDGLWRRNPVTVQLLGVCSALAVTGRLETAVVMSAVVMFVCSTANLVISLLRNYTPPRIRLIIWICLIGTFVILADEVCKAFLWEIQVQLGPYVGLIITNCIILGRAEAFASRNSPLLSALDGLANGLGYGVVLCVVAVIRELLGTGRVFGRQLLLAEWYTPNQLMILAPGAFIVLGFLIALFNVVRPPEEEQTP